MARTVATFRSGIIKNGSFEVGTGSISANGWIGSEAYGWYGSFNDTGTMSFDTTVFHSGTQSIKIDITSGTTKPNGISTTGLASFWGSSSRTLPLISKYGIAVKPSTTYRLSAWMKVSSAQDVSFQYQQFSALGGERLAIGYLYNSSYTNTDWAYNTVQFTTNVSTAYVEIDILLYQAAAASLWIDDLFLQQVSRTTAATRSAASTRNLVT